MLDHNWSNWCFVRLEQLKSWAGLGGALVDWYWYVDQPCVHYRYLCICIVSPTSVLHT